MSYSRWGSSFWYTYPSVSLDCAPDNRDTAVFCICGIIDFTAKGIRDDIDGCVNLANSVFADMPSQDRPTFQQLKELRGYMKQFLAEVDERFGVAE